MCHNSESWYWQINQMEIIICKQPICCLNIDHFEISEKLQVIENKQVRIGDVI